MDPITVIALALGAVGIITNLITNNRNAVRQEQHDIQMANIQKQNEKELMDYSTEISANTNTIATQKGHAAAAGYSPALLYGQMSTPGLQDVSGSASGSANTIEPLRLFDRMTPGNVVENIMQQRQQALLREQTNSNVALNTSQIALNNARAMEQIRDTAQRKKMEKVIYDSAMASLDFTRAQTDNMRFVTSRGQQFLPLELEQAGLLNQRTAADVQRIVSETAKNRYQMSEISANIRRLDKLNEVSDAEKGSIVESTKRSAVGRIMAEMGLNNIKLPPSMRGWSLNKMENPFYYMHREQIDGALTALLALGFSPDEASRAVLYYVAESPKDVSPSLANGLSRIASALLLKK